MKLISGRPVSSDPASQDCFDVANSWLRECMSSGDHQFCKSKIQGNASGEFGGPQTPLPTRLIDVGPPDGSQEPRLILASGIKTSSSQSYAALSHCWGGTPLAQIGSVSLPDSLSSIQTSVKGTPSNVIAGGRPLTTLTVNIEDRMKSIPMNILPRTFRDAVKVTRGLGLRYIWIDSLCIIQDSKSDWEQEAAQMADIYKNSYVTIAAEGSRDSHEGILTDRLFDFSPIELPFKSKLHNIQTSMFVRPALDDWETTLSEPKSKLCSRAWVLQESLLAPRTIHYGLQQMMWECRSRSLAEGDMTPIAPSTREKNWSWSRNKRFLSDVGGATSSIDDTQMEGHTAKDMSYLQWYSIINDYSSRRMTFSSDVFPALAGLATEFNRRLCDQFVAGLWKGDLSRGLLWIVADSERAKAAVPYRAPTWSWASIVGQVGTSSLDDCLYMVGIYHTEILSVETTPVRHTAISSDGNYYSEISSGSLRLRGRWKATSHWSKFEEEYYQSHIIPGTEENMGIMFRYFDCGTEERYLERHQNGRNLSLLHIATWVQKMGDAPVMYFLILESADGGDESFFRRVGVVLLHNGLNVEKWFQEWEVKTVLIK